MTRRMRTGLFWSSVLAGFLLRAGAAERTFVPAAVPDTDRAAEVNDVLKSAAKGDVLRFAKGDYFFSDSIVIAGRNGVTLSAEPGTVFRFRFRSNGLDSGALKDIVVTDSTNVVLQGFVCTTDRPVSVSGRVVASCPESRSYDVKLEGDSYLDGTESLCTADSCDESGSPDHLFSCHYMNPVEEDDGHGGKVKRSRGMPYCWKDARTFRVTVPESRDYAELEPGHRIVFRLAIFGRVFTLRGVRDVRIRDVTVWRCPSICAVIAPLSSDIAFENFRVCPAPDSKALFSSNADGIHVVGMSGTLTLRNCRFEGFGDDPLNVHGKASELLSYNAQTGEATCAWRLFHGEPIPMDEKWAVGDDVLVVYERTTFREKGTMRVRREIGRGVYVLKPQKDVRPSVGDILVNTRDRPKVRISGCSVKNVRSRGFLLQSQDVDVSDCRFVGIGGAAVLVAPDINNWYESGPANGLTLRNCRFERCGFRPMSFGAVTVKVNHEGPVDAFPAGVHRNIELDGCTFTDCGETTNVCIAATSGVKVRNCRFERTKSKSPVVFVNCGDVE